MNFLNPIALWGLLILAVPIILHLLKKSETREREWAAMEFLLKKEAHSVRKHSLEKWLLLLSRLALLAFLLCALAQPLGRLFSFSRKAPETIFLLIDRSSEMAAVNERGDTLMEEGLAEVQRVLEGYEGQSRLYLIDSAGLERTPVLEAENLELLTQTEMVDTPCTAETLLKKAQSFLGSGEYGASECWLLTTGHKEVWQPENAAWKNAVGSAAAVRYFPVSSTVKDLRLSLSSAKLSDGRVNLSLNITGNVTEEALLLSGKVAGAETFTQEVKLQQGQTEYALSLPWSEDYVTGELSLPVDGNLRNNTAYFSLGPARPLRTLLVTDEENSALSLNLQRALSLRSKEHQEVKWMNPEMLSVTDFSAYDAVVWAASKENASLKGKLDAFITEGGLGVVFPNPEEESHD